MGTNPKYYSCKTFEWQNNFENMNQFELFTFAHQRGHPLSMYAKFSEKLTLFKKLVRPSLQTNKKENIKNKTKFSRKKSKNH